MTAQRINKLKRKLQEARFRLFRNNSEFADPLYDMVYVATDKVWRISTNGTYLYFDPDWLQKLNELELDYILSHQLMHIKYNHIGRSSYYRGERFHLACDIIANSHLRKFGWNYDKIPHIGNIYFETFFPRTAGNLLTPERAFVQVPFDPAVLSDGSRRRYMIDSDAMWEQKNAKDEIGIIILSPLDKDPSDLSIVRYKKKSGVYRSDRKEYNKQTVPFENRRKGHEQGRDKGASEENSMDKEVLKILQTIRSAKSADETLGHDKVFSKRYWKMGNDPSIDWKKLLNRFVQEEVCDYSFTPPDNRYYESAFFMPDYNVVSDITKNILFMVDTSGSIADETLNKVFTELQGAINQFSGLHGIICFFDVHVSRPVFFNDVNSIAQIIPSGGGGTDFYAVFQDIGKLFHENPPSSIVVFTDGIGDFPDETVADGIPVLWLLTSKDIKAPWGKSAWI